MGKPLMIQPEDDQRIEILKTKLGARTKVEVLRAGLTLLEQETERMDRIVRWKKAAGLVSESSSVVNREFRRFSRMKRG